MRNTICLSDEQRALTSAARGEGGGGDTQPVKVIIFVIIRFTAGLFSLSYNRNDSIYSWELNKGGRLLRMGK